MDDTPLDPFADPVLGPLLERALARYGPHVTPEQLAELRDVLALLVEEHPELAALAEQARQEVSRRATQESGVVEKRGKRKVRGTGTDGGGDR